MDIYPLARRVLLTAYADTHAAIDAINVVDLDHYLLKPWDPPEEKLYPVIDGLLEAWHATGDRAIPHTKVIGHRWNPRSWEVRQFLARNQHSFRSFMADEPKGKQLLDAAGLDGLQLPVVITEQGETLVEPTNAELADDARACPPARRWRCTTSPSSAAARPGLAAAVYGASEGLKTVLIEKHDDRRSGRAQLADRELPRLPHRRLGRRADHLGAQAGRAVRRRGDHHPQGRRAGRRRLRPARSSSTTAAPSAPRPSSWPPASTTASCRRPAAGTTRTTRAHATTSAAASTTAPRCPTPRNATAKTSTSSAARTRPARPRCSCRARRSR